MLCAIVLLLAGRIIVIQMGVLRDAVLPTYVARLLYYVPRIDWPLNVEKDTI